MNSSRAVGLGIDIAYWVLFLSTPGLGLLLADFDNLKIYKLLNLIGIVWSILGVITLSYLAAASEDFKVSALRVSSYVFGILVVSLPIGIAMGGVFAMIFQYPSAKVAATIGLYLMFPGFVSFAFFRELVAVRTPTSRRILLMGGYFVIAGLLAQGAGAFFDLVDFNG